MIVTTISKGVNRCNTHRILCNSIYAPSVVGVFCNGYKFLIYTGYNFNNVALQILNEIVGNIVVDNTTYGIFVIVERNKRLP